MKVYFDKNLIQKEYLSFLAPLLWCPDFDIWGEEKKQIKERYSEGKKLLVVSEKKDCDFYVYPKYFLLDNFDELQAYANDAQINGKKVIVFSYWEIDDYIDINKNILWHKRCTKINNPSNEFCLPPFPEDLLKYNDNKINFIKEWKKKKYSIGYTWYSNYYNIRSFLYYISVRCIWSLCRMKPIKKLLMRYKKEALYWRLVNAWIWNYCRWKTIREIKKLEKYELNFIQRNHALTTTGTKKDMREEYIRNLNESDFALVVRWFGNYSFRQYEALSLGKIPIYIDTWAKLPFQNKINYNELFIIVPIEKIKKIGNYIDNYIKKNKWKLKEIQRKIRKTYEDYFTIKNYYSKIIENLKK
jgi:hypothetical protein